MGSFQKQWFENIQLNFLFEPLEENSLVKVPFLRDVAFRAGCFEMKLSDYSFKILYSIISL